ncbi:hypothetical protein [Spiroplasma endosymbiont of Polydrusus formosus]|uniref:hypothetical protein n=1 Tax=Spiroplasma endosymbiont of Polydrusus formosus TaxID=3139326 RepID=UPI0035B51286
MLRSLAMQYNYYKIRTLIFEAKNLFVRSVGTETDIVSKEMFELLDKKRTIICFYDQKEQSL